jgi:hypothetical protein
MPHTKLRRWLKERCFVLAPLTRASLPLSSNMLSPAVGFIQTQA